MSRVFEHYGISADCFESKGEFEALSEDEGPSELSEIREVINLTVPKKCGHELIRVGTDGGGKNPTILDDGKYLLPDDLDGVEACFSPGVANTKGFEDDLAERFGIKSYMCDFSSDENRFSTPIIPGMQKFRKKWLDISETEDSISLEEWLTKDCPGDRDLILQIDIEGAEYRNILTCKDETLSRFRIIAMEVHGLHFLGRNDFLRGIFKPFIEKICKFFTCVHAHPNNNAVFWNASSDLQIPRIMEFTFLRKDRCNERNVEIHIPHPLDIVNTTKKPPAFLSEPWANEPLSMESTITIVRQKLEWLEKVNEEKERRDEHGG